MKKFTDILTIALFMGLLIVPTLIWGVKKISGSDAFEVQLEENRALSAFPDKFSSDVTKEIEAYYNDRVPFRSVMLHTYSVCDGKIEGAYRTSLQPLLVKISGRKGIGDTTNLAQKYNNRLEELNKKEQKQNKDVVIPNSPDPQPGADPVEEPPLCASVGHLFEPTDVVVAPTLEQYGHTEYRCAYCGKISYRDFTEKLIDNSFLPENIANKQVILGRYNWLFFAGDASRAYYTGSNVMNEAYMAERVADMNRLKEACDAQGKTVVYAIWPNKEQIYPEYMPTYQIQHPIKREPAFKDYVDTHSDLKLIYPIDYLMSGKLYRDTYYPYDTHWNYWGSYIGTMALYEKIDMPTTGPDDWNIETVPSTARGLVGTGLLDPEVYVNDCDYNIDYRPGVELSYVEGNRLLTGGYTYVYRACSAAPLTDKKIVIIGDSFRISMLPYIEKDFAMTTAAQREYIDEIADDIRNADIIVVTAVERFDHDMFERIPQITSILTQ